MLLALDLGTSSLKAMLVDRDGRTLAHAQSGYELDTPHPGWSEIAPQRWWKAAIDASAQLDPRQRAAVRALGVCGQMHGVVLCDPEADALRSAILWLDTRGKTYLDQLPRDLGPRTGNAPAAGTAATSLLWVRENEPHVYADARWALQPKDWLRAQLCGEIATDASDASGTLLADRNGNWDRALIADLRLRADWLAPVRESAAVGGGLRAGAAQELGLASDIPIVVGAADTAAAAFSSGLRDDLAAQLTIGTGAQLVVMREKCPAFRPELNCFRSANSEGHAPWYVMAAMLNAGSVLNWARKLFQLSWDEAYQLAAQTPANDLLFLPHLSGERTPLMNPGARGAWLGLSTADSRATMLRAAFEGVAFSIRAGLDALQRAGHHITALRLAGGGSLHPWWRHLLADALGMPLHGTDATGHDDASARGAALLAGMGIGYWSAADLIHLSPRWRVIVEPRGDTKLVLRCDRYVRACVQLREQLSE